jgi:tyrosine-protein kinase Etk/Wzc
MATSDTPQQREDDDIDIKAILGTLVDHKWLILMVGLVFAIFSIAYAILATPIYQANAVVQVEQKVPELPGLSAISQTLGASSSEATTEIALIQSRMVLSQAVQNLALNVVIAPHRFPLIGDYIARHFVPLEPGKVASPRWGLSSYDWGGSELRLLQFDLPRALLGKPLLLTAGANQAFTLTDGDGNVLVQGKAGVLAQDHGIKILISKLSANPGTRFDVEHDPAQATVAQLQLDLVAAEQGKDSGIIGLVYQNADPDLAVALLNQVSQIYVRQNVDRNSAQAATSLAFVKEQLPIVRHELDAAQDAMAKFQQTAHSVDVSLQTKALLDQAVALDTSIQDLRMQQVQADRLYTKDHPAYRAILQQLSQLQGQKAVLEKQVGTLPDTQQQLLKLKRDVEVTNATYTGLLNQAQQLDIARAGTVGNVRIIDTAEVDVTHPVKPKRAAIVFGGTFLGLLLAIGFVYVRQSLRRGVEDPASIEQLGLAVYASVPLSETERETSIRGRQRVKAAGHHRLLAVDSPADLAVEALRSLRTSLHFARLEAKNNLLMISGSSPAAGKTFISGNLAAVIAQAGQRVLLIDADMRKGALHQVMGGRPERGLSELVSGQIDMEAAVRKIDGLDNLHFIARGKVPPNPSELLMNSAFTRLLKQFSDLYDLVIIDTPPILAVTDAAIIGHHVGTSLLVIRFGLNQVKEVALAKHRFQQNGVELKGAIFNAVEKRNAGYYSYGYYEYKSAT